MDSAAAGGTTPPERADWKDAGVFVVIPAFNEGQVLDQTVRPLIEAGFSVVVVDDCSNDDTWRISERLGVNTVRQIVNLGQGAALQTGMEFALRNGAQIVVHFDADGQHDWRQIPNLVTPVLKGEVDVVYGSRFLRRGDASAVPRGRRLMLSVGRIVSGVFTGVFLSDTHNGFRALSRKAAAAVTLRENGFAHATEILGQIRRAQLRYMEVPTSISYTEYSLSKGQRIGNFINTFIDLVLRRIFP